MSVDIKILADRHFLADPQEVLVPRNECKCGRVLITVVPNVVNTLGGQHLAWMLVNLLARQFGLVSEITLNVPDSKILPNAAAFGVYSTLKETLEVCIRLVAGEHVKINATRDDTKKFDVHIVVGISSVSGLSDRTLYVYADGWRWYVGNGNTMPAKIPRSRISIGPYMAACFAAGEVFKYLMGMQPGKGEFISELFGSAWSQNLNETWADLPSDPADHELPLLQHFYFAGAGAVGQSAALTLGSSGLQGEATVVDHDKLDFSNDNRYVLSTIEDVGTAKVKLLSSYMSNIGLKCHPVEKKWSDYVGTCGREAVSKEIRELESKQRFFTVLSCVDKNKPRHEIQKLLPHTIIGASTDGLVAKASIFYLGHESACLKCYNPIEDRNSVIQQNQDKLLDMSPRQRKDWCADHGISTDVAGSFLVPQKCGKLSENDLDRFAADEPEMSVGFVSVAAGVMLATQLIRINMLGIDTVTENGSIVVATFARPGIRHYKNGSEASCDCRTSLRERWNRMWDT